MPVLAIADAIVKIAVNKMSLAVREVSVAKGYDPRDFAMVASGGAGPLHAVAIAGKGDVRNATIEGIELKCPVLIEQRALRADSGGAGKFRGGLGIDVNVVNLVDGRWNFQGSLRRTAPPWGLWGGGTGGTHTFFLKEPEDAEFREMDAHRFAVPPRSEVVVRTGGGGWGDPLDRDPERVSADVSEGYVSLAAAERDYGVVLDAKTLEVDGTATTALRRTRRR